MGEVELEDLTPLRLFFKMEQGCAHRFLARSLERSGRDISDFRHVVFYDDLLGLVQKVRDGSGLGLVSRELVKEDLDSGVLVAHKLKGMDHVRPRSLVVPSHFQMSDPIHEFLSVLFADFGLPVPDDFL